LAVVSDEVLAGLFRGVRIDARLCSAPNVGGEEVPISLDEGVRRFLVLRDERACSPHGRDDVEDSPGGGGRVLLIGD
jgi:hypothetical protein